MDKHETDSFDPLRRKMLATAALGAAAMPLGLVEVQSPDFASATIPGAATTVQIMVKDAKKYAASVGWGFGRFIDGVPTDEAQHRTCFACHQAHVKDRDYVFTHFAP